MGDGVMRDMLLLYERVFDVCRNGLYAALSGRGWVKMH